MATPRKTTSDKPKAMATLSSLEAEVTEEAFTFGIKNKIITFPNPADMEWSRAEEFMQSLDNATATQVLEAWLSEADYTALKNAGLTLRQMNALMQQVSEYYASVFGDQEKG